MPPPPVHSSLASFAELVEQRHHDGQARQLFPSDGSIAVRDEEQLIDQNLQACKGSIIGIISIRRRLSQSLYSSMKDSYSVRRACASNISQLRAGHASD
ncbi:uncharacterized protein UV8b_01734 [Ustilaginoidea virens]|uniref:Uncharacterized protein n=1 Tax=Ustilaginoidea virens TaxID=1159556 RepID=A0A8E5MEN7_USTVR|nr:uncharacterized protein UV8b_01734 [Ustilaginoidea virens]QUC17493.1 hypothetical protein UV8b_01734 [Ustilaginoidea virens]